MVASREGSACVEGTWECDGHASKQSAGSAGSQRGGGSLASLETFTFKTCEQKTDTGMNSSKEIRT